MECSANTWPVATAIVGVAFAIAWMVVAAVKS